MNSYTFNVDFTDTVEAETEDEAVDIFWEKLVYTATAKLIESQEVEEDD